MFSFESTGYSGNLFPGFYLEFRLGLIWFGLEFRTLLNSFQSLPDKYNAIIIIGLLHEIKKVPEHPLIRESRKRHGIFSTYLALLGQKMRAHFVSAMLQT